MSADCPGVVAGDRYGGASSWFGSGFAARRARPATTERRTKGVPIDVGEATAQLQEFVLRSLGKPDLTGRDDIAVGEASSLYSMELVLFIEEKLGIPLDDDDLVPDRIDSRARRGGLIVCSLSAGEIDDWSIGTRPLLDLDYWDLRMILSDRY